MRGNDGPAFDGLYQIPERPPPPDSEARMTLVTPPGMADPEMGEGADGSEGDAEEFEETQGAAVWEVARREGGGGGDAGIP